MSDDQVVEQTQSAPVESADTQSQQVDTSKIFSKGYNEGKAKAERDVLAKLGQMGIEAEALEQAFQSLNEKVAPRKQEQNEVEQLRKMLEEANSKAQQAQDDYEAFVYETRLDASVDGAVGSLKNDGSLSIKEQHLKSLFYSEYEVEERDGQFYVTKDSAPVLDQEGNRKALAVVLREFAKDNGYVKPNVEGAGGSSGHTQFSDKPSREEFQRLIRSKSAEAQSKAAEMYAMAKKAGGWS